MKRGIKALSASCLFLAAALLSCGEAAAPANTPDTLSVTAENAAETEPAETRVQHQVPVDTLDFGGAEYRSDYPDWQGYRYYFFASDENGDVMNDAIWARTRRIEEALNVKFVNTVHDTILTVISDTKPLILAGEDFAEAVYLHCLSGVATFTSEGYLTDIDGLPYIDLNADWWNKTQMDALRLGKNTYYAIGDYMIPCPYLVYFNKKLVEELDFDDPYELVFSGKWTLDRMTEMARLAKADLNGDGKMTDADRYGIAANEISKYNSFVTGSGQFLTAKNAENKLELAVNTPKMQSLVERFAALAKENVCYLPKADDYSIDGVNIDTGKLMFQLAAISTAESYREYTTDFGFLPYPKYDEAQENYISLDWGGLMGVPVTAQNHELCGAVMELLAYESAAEVIPTYYNTVLTGKLSRDENAVKVLDIVFDTITYEPGGNYFGSGDLGDLFYCLPRLAVQNMSTDFASWYKKNEKKANKAFEKFYTALDAAENADG